MIAMDIKHIVKVLAAIGAFNAIAQDGVIQPLDESGHGSNKCASVTIVLANDDPTLPQWMTAYSPQSDFIVTGNVATARVKVGGKIRIENNSDWPYVFGRQCKRTGYYSLEIDMMMDDGNIICLKKRKPELLGDDGSLITLKAQRQWECLVSLDRRLWDFPAEIAIKKVKKIRPRFAFGAYNVDGTYYRTIDEIKNARKKDRRFDDRDGELVGDWIDCNVCVPSNEPPRRVIGMSENKTLSVVKSAKNDEHYTQYADHLTSWSKGGATDKNCQMFCRTHNPAKGNR